MRVNDVEERIRRRAYEIWERAGSPHGRDWEHWVQARDEIAAEDGLKAAEAENAIPGEEDIARGEPVIPAVDDTSEADTSQNSPALSARKPRRRAKAAI